MRVNVDLLKRVVNDIASKANNNRMSNLTVINSHDFFINLSVHRKEKLLVSLNPQSPFISLVEINSPVGTKMGALSDALRKEAKEGLITSIEMVENDRVVAITYFFTNEFYDREKRQIVIELIPHRPNLIILNGEGKVIFATHYLDLSNERPILKGLSYQPPINKTSSTSTEDLSLEDFKAEANKYYLRAKQLRVEEGYKPVIQRIKTRIKSLKRKIDILEEGIKTSEKNMSYKDIGQMILTYAEDEKELNSYLLENSIAYDHSLTPGVNANKYFKLYKKAKRTIEINEVEIDKTKDEIEYLETSLAQIPYMHEEDVIEIANLLFPHKFKIGSKTKIESKPGEIIVEGIKILYGKNAKQNDQLTFKKANKSDNFYHIKDAHGSHVIVQSEKPSNEVILTACEIALILSGKECGEVINTSVKNIKKGSFLGQALFTSYQTYNINSIREETKELLKSN